MIRDLFETLAYYETYRSESIYSERFMRIIREGITGKVIREYVRHIVLMSIFIEYKNV